MEIRIYFEGVKTLRAGFESFFADLRNAALEAKVDLRFIAARDGPSDFRRARRSNPSAWNILLKDSEGPKPANVQVLLQKHGIDSVFADDVFWMVELMESWFLADVEALEDYYANGFRTKAIGSTHNVETVRKSDVQRRLKAATKDTSKGPYHKVRHAPRLLELLDASRVKKRAPHCQEFFEAVLTKISSAQLPQPDPMP